MPAPNDQALTLQSMSNAIKQVYAPTFRRMEGVKGTMTNALIKPSKKNVGGDGINIKVKRGPGHFVRMTRDPMSDFSRGKGFDPDEIKVRWTPNVPSTHDFSRVDVAIPIDWYSLKGYSQMEPHAIVDHVQELMRDAREGFDTRMAIARHCDRTGLLANVNGTKKNDDGYNMAAASAYTNGSTSFRVQIDGGSVAVFQRNWRYDIYNGNTLVLNNVSVTSIDPTDTSNASEGSVGFAITADTTTAANCDAVADNFTIYFAGTKDANVYSLGAWFSNPGTSDSFIGGKNRSQSGSRWLVPPDLRRGASGTVRISRDHLNDIATAVGFVNDDPNAINGVSGGPRLMQALREDIEADAIVQVPISDASGARYANFGTAGLSFQHPTMGRLNLMGDPFAKPDTLRFIVGEDWESYGYGSSDLEFFPGEIGIFRNVPSGTPGAGASMTWEAYGLCNVADFCTYPGRQAQISGLSAA